MKSSYYFDDFTENHYRELLRQVRSGWECISFNDCYREDSALCLWRHDVDFSIHRAHCLAKIEFEEGIRSTFFVHLHSEFYNLFERDVIQHLLEIKNLGHNIGLHFDPRFYQEIDAFAGRNINNLIAMEKQWLENLLQHPVEAISFHQPEAMQDKEVLNCNSVEGMVNAYGDYIQKRYAYCSDSNGYWRFKRLVDFLKEAPANIQVLTHPGWWVPVPMSPHERVNRCITGRAEATRKNYDDKLRLDGRLNVTAASNV